VHAILHAAIARGATVLVHCAAGVSRSPTLVAAYLMLERGYSATEALDFVGKRRTGISPNTGFVEQLSALNGSVGCTWPCTRPPRPPVDPQGVQRPS
jgi:protein-tyrosine phosphatase